MALRLSRGVWPAGRHRLGTSGGGLAPLYVVLLAVFGTLLALTILVWSAWQKGDPRVVLDVPKASVPDPAQAASGVGDGHAGLGERPDARDDADEADDAAVEPAEGDVEAALEVGDPAFFETPMQVVRRSNIRAEPTPDSSALGRAEEGTMVILVEPEPTRGYYRIATGELEGWIWGANLVAADVSQQPEAEAGAEEASPPADERSAAARP